MEINNNLMNKVEEDSKLLDEVVDKVVQKSTGNLEAYVESIKEFLENGVDKLTLDDLNNMSLRVASYLFFLSTNLEKVGLRQAVANQLRDEKYNYEYSTNATGTIADKQAYALAKVKEEDVINTVFDKAYKILKMRYSSTERLVDVIRKVITSRIAEMQLSGKVNI